MMADYRPSSPVYRPSSPDYRPSSPDDRRPTTDDQPTSSDHDYSSSTYMLRVRVQLLFPMVGIVRSLWKYQYLPLVIGQHPIDRKIVLVNFAYHRLNAHDGLVDFVYRVLDSKYDRTPDLPAKTTTTFADVRFVIVDDVTRHDRRIATRKRTRENHVIRILEHSLGITRRDLLGPGPLPKPRKPRLTGPGLRKPIDNFCRDADWWFDVLARHPRQKWFDLSEAVLNAEERERTVTGKRFKRTARLLSMLTTMVRDRYVDVQTHEQAIEIIVGMSETEQRTIDKLYVEPMTASLFVSYLNTIFMSTKQQHGLNTKHAAAASNSANGQTRKYCSDRPFDPKIYLDMCSICSTRDIFEIMIKLDKRAHPELPCECALCNTLCGMANAWMFYDCVDVTRLRLEFNRRFYAKVVNLLVQYPDQRSKAGEEYYHGDATLVYQSYKNEFTDRASFVSNFVNYYSFYENDEQPVSIEDIGGYMEIIVSNLFVFGIVNFELLLCFILAGKGHNSISLNQQSMFKSMDNMLYAVFNKNSIDRVQKETKQNLSSIGSSYMNRGFGSLPNNGINAITSTIL